MKTKYWMLVGMVALVLGAVVASGGLALAAGEVGQEEASFTVDINHAGVEELMKLPRVGRTVAERIVAYREENGPFEKTEELMNVRGIGEKTYLELEPFIVIEGGGTTRDGK